MKNRAKIVIKKRIDEELCDYFLFWGKIEEIEEIKEIKGDKGRYKEIEDNSFTTWYYMVQHGTTNADGMGGITGAHQKSLKNGERIG